MSDGGTLGHLLARRGVSRRALMKYSAYLASLMALPPAASKAMAEGLAKAPRQSVIWLSFQECTGCTEAITRAYSPTLESLIFDLISLDYHHTLQAASGDAAAVRCQGICGINTTSRGRPPSRARRCWR